MGDKKLLAGRHFFDGLGFYQSAEAEFVEWGGCAISGDAGSAGGLLLPLDPEHSSYPDYSAPSGSWVIDGDGEPEGGGISGCGGIYGIGIFSPPPGGQDIKLN